MALYEVSLPCKPGTLVFGIHELTDEQDVPYWDILNGEVVSFSIEKNNIWIYVRYFCGLTYYHTLDEFDVSVFTDPGRASSAVDRKRGEHRVSKN